MRSCGRLLCTLFVLFPVTVIAQVASPEFVSQPVGVHYEGAPLRLAEARHLPPVAILPDAELAAREQILAIQQWNDSGKPPLKNGFTRMLEQPVVLNLDPHERSNSSAGIMREISGDVMSISTSIHVVSAERIRLHLTGLESLHTAGMWVWGSQGDVTPFGLELRSDAGDLWTPSVAGEHVFLEIQVPLGEGVDAQPLVIDRVMQILSRDQIHGRDLIETDSPESPRLQKFASELPGIEPQACDLTTLGCGSSLTRAIDSTDCQTDSNLFFDLYAYQVSQKQKFSVTVTAPGEEITIELYDAETLRYLTAETGGNGVTLRYSSLGSRTLLIIVGFARAFGFGEYTLQTSCEEGCLEDANCIGSSTLDVVDSARQAVAFLNFIVDGSSGICSGALVVDSDDTSVIPYMLTANHCFSSGQSALSLEAFWDFRSNGCLGSEPDVASLPRSNGASLLATSDQTDFTLVRLNSVPSNRVFLGWDARASALRNGAVIHRIAHPMGLPQAYSQYRVTTTSPTCGTLPRPEFVYSQQVLGSASGGSSGGPSFLSGGLIVGQLLGTCGSSDDFCSTLNQQVDGALSVTFPSIAQWLDPGSQQTEPCQPSATTACLLSGRFKATLRYRAAFDDQPVNTNGFVKSVSGFGDPNFETAFFYFNSPNNIEVMLKMLDQGNTNGQGQPTIAVLFGTATPLRAEITITDTKTGATKTYTSGFNQMKGTTDFTAFVK